MSSLQKILTEEKRFAQSCIHAIEQSGDPEKVRAEASLTVLDLYSKRILTEVRRIVAKEMKTAYSATESHAAPQSLINQLDEVL